MEMVIEAEWVEFLLLFVVAGVVGSIGAEIAGRHTSLGCLGSVVVGFAGALFGRWLSRQIGVGEVLSLFGFPVIWGAVGAAIFVALLGLLSGGRRYV